MTPVPRLDFLKMGGIVPVVVQDDSTQEVLMLAFMNEEAWQRTLETGQMWYYSRKRNKLWMKGEQSGNVQRVRELRIDCDNDTVLAMVEQVGGACDLGYRSCFDKAVRDGELVHVGVNVFEPHLVYPYEEALKTIAFAKSLPLDMAQFSILCPYPGSPLFTELVARGEIDTGIREDGRLDPSIWKRYSSYICFTDNEPIWVTPTMTSKQLRALQKRAQREFYLRPSQIWRQLKRARPNNIIKMARIAWRGFF